MTKKHFLLLALLICGLIFSSHIRITFNLHGGFVFQSWWFRIIPIPLFDHAESSSENMTLTSTVFGYVFYVVAGILFIYDVRDNRRWLLITLGFIFVTLYAIYFELTAMIHDLLLDFSGEHLWAGPVLFLLGLLIYFKSIKIRAANL